MNRSVVKRLAAAWIGTIALGTFGQSISSLRAFDVASLRENRTGGASVAGPTRDGYRATNVPILRLIAEAYVPTTKSEPYFEYDRIVGAPDWARTDNFTLDARVAESDLAAWHEVDSQKRMLRSMMQALLAERCKLVAHRETKELTFFALAPTRNGPKLKEASTSDPAKLKRQHPGGIALPDGGVFVRGDGTMNFFGVSMMSLCQILSVPAGHPVQDKTGLEGRYDFSLKLRDQGLTSTGTDGDQALSIFTVMPEQLGLRLQSEKGEVEVLVIDHIEKPSEN